MSILTLVTQSNVFLNAVCQTSYHFFATDASFYIYMNIFVDSVYRFLFGCSFVLHPLLKIGDEDLQNDLINELNEWELNAFQRFTLELCIRFTTPLNVSGYLPLNVPLLITSSKPR